MLRIAWMSLSIVCLMNVACKTRQYSPDRSQIQSGGGAFNPVTEYQINKSMRHGDFFEVPLSPQQKLKQITMVYSGNYKIHVFNPDGSVRRNDEGDPYYKDGMYANGFVLDSSGNRKPVAAAKFVDANETDNWHDIPPLTGVTLRVEFSHRAEYLADPVVAAANTEIQMIKVIIQYADPEGLKFEEFVYNSSYDDTMNADAHPIISGGYFSQSFDGTKKITRVDVRWGDAKPRTAEGVYVPGSASGYIQVNGANRSDTRNVAAIETQIFAGLNILPRHDGQDHEISVHMIGDSGRVHFVKVFYE